jgi:hypothetical protein
MAQFAAGEGRGAVDLIVGTVQSASPAALMQANATCYGSFGTYGLDLLSVAATCNEALNPFLGLTKGFHDTYVLSNKGCYFTSGRAFFPAMAQTVALVDGVAAARGVTVGRAGGAGGTGSALEIRPGGASSGPSAGGSAAAPGQMPGIKPGASGGVTAGMRFPDAVKDAAIAENLKLTGSTTPTCVWCRMEAPTNQIDHAVPRSLDGDATLENAQVACPHCNMSRGNRPNPITPPEGYEGPWPPPWWPKE